MSSSAGLCASCQSALVPGARFCAQCGTSVQGASPPGDELIGQLIGGYRVLALIGEGGMGKVYRAEQERLKRPVCIKTLLPHFAKDQSVVQRFEREGLATASMRHPNVVTVLDFGRTESGTLYIVMEYVEGRTLRVVLREESPVPVERALALTTQVLSALDEAHGQGVVHRDLKPSNVLVSRLRDGSEMVKVVDFGIAKLTSAEKSEQGLTRTGLMVGTPGYMAPEQLTNEPVSPATDLYAAGVILWELLTGKRLFAAKSELETLNRQLSQVVASPSTVSPLPVPKALDEICLKAVERMPDRRFASALEFRRALEGIGATVRAKPAAPEAMLVPASEPEPKAAGPLTVDALSKLLPSQLASYTRTLASQLAKSERRTLHAFFLELSLDADHAARPDVRPALDQLFSRFVEVVTAAGGVAERSFGSCLAAVFGVRALREDDAERCVRAATDCRALVAESGARAATELTVRIGVCSATVQGVDPDAAFHDNPAVNEVLALARRVEGAAEADEIVLTRSVRASTRDGFTVVDRPSASGIAEPLYRLVSSKEGKTRDEPLVGRERERALLASFIDTLTQRRSGGALLVGQPGIGKSRLLRHAEGLARAGRLTVACARAGRHGHAASLDVVRQLVRSVALGDGAGDDASRTTLEALRRLGLGSVDAQRLDSLFAVTTNPGARGPAEDERLHERAALLELFQRATAQQPLLLLIDDAHLADEPSLELLGEVVALASPSHPIGLLATARAGETDRVLPRLKRVEVGPLTPADLSGVVSGVLRRGHPPSELVEAVWARCEGNPEHGRELVNALLETGHLRFANGAWSFDAADAELPDSLAHVVAARLERVSAHAKTLLRFGAVIGRTFPVDLVSAAVESPIDLTAAAAECVRRGLLEPHEHQRGSLQFSQALVRETLLKRLAPADRRHLHRLIGEALERGVSAGDEHPLDAMSRHFVGSEQPRKAMKYLRQAADRWAEKHAFDVAARLYREAHALLAKEAARLGPLSDVTSGHLLELAAAAASAMGMTDPKQALEFLDAAVGVIPETRRGRARAEALRQRAGVLLKLARPADAVADLRKALALGAAGDDLELMLALRTELASALEASGQLAAATAELVQVLEHSAARAPSNPAGRWQCLNQLGRVHLRLGQLGEAQAFFENALSAATQANDLAGQGRVAANQMVLAAQRGDGALVERLYREAQALAHEAGDRLGALRTRYNRATWLRTSGRSAEADAELQDVASRARAIGWKEGEAMAAAARASGIAS